MKRTNKQPEKSGGRANAREKPRRGGFDRSVWLWMEDFRAMENLLR